MRYRRQRLQSWATLLILALFVACNLTSRASADVSQQDLFRYQIHYFDIKVNTGSCGTTGTSSVNLVGADNQAKLMNFFVSQGFTPTQAAGAVGNMLWESGGALDPKALESGGLPAGDGGIGPTGHGIVQWSFERWRSDYGDSRAAQSARKSDLTDYAPFPPQSGLDPNTLLGFAASKGTSWYDLGTQAEFMLKEISPGGSRAGVLDKMKAATSVADAATIWFDDYEQPGDSTLGSRIDLGNKALQTYGGGDSSSTSGSSTSTGSSSSSGGSCGGAVTCTNSSSTAATGTTPAAGATTTTTPAATATDGLSAVRQNVVCLAQQELAAWTPLPPIPRMQYLKYSDNAQEEWCADFVSWLYKQANDPFTGGDSGGWRLAAVSEIMALGQQNGSFHWHDAEGYTPKPGDIAIHKNGASHTNLVISVSGSNVTLIGGDQGPGPYGGPDSASIVSQVTQPISGGDMTGYVSPD